MKFYDEDSVYDMDNPKHRQGIVDALVEAGVLEVLPSGATHGQRYTVVQPSPCSAWIDCGHGHQQCSREAGHEGSHRSSANPRTDVIWMTNNGA